MSQSEKTLVSFVGEILKAVGDRNYTIGVNQGPAGWSEKTIEARGSDRKLTISGPANVTQLGPARGVTLEQGGIVTFSESERQGPTRIRNRKTPYRQVGLIPPSGSGERYSVMMTRRRTGIFPFNLLLGALFGPVRYHGEEVTGKEIIQKLDDGWNFDSGDTGGFSVKR